MKLFYTPGGCSIGIHIILREIGAPFELERVLTKEGGTRTPGYLAMNPKGKIPALIRDDGSVLTEFPAIAFYLAWSNPQAHLLPADVEGMARALELFEYLVSTVHMQGLHRVFAPQRVAEGADVESVRQDGRTIVERAFALLDPVVADSGYLLGSFSIADCPMFYVLYNSRRLGLDIPPNLQRHLARMLQRPSVRDAVEAEGIADWMK